MKQGIRALFLLGLLSAPIILIAQETGSKSGTETGLRKQQPSIPVETIIQKFAEKEEEFRLARDHYTFRQTAQIEVLSPGGGKTGEQFLEVDDVLFDDKGRRVEKVLKAPPSTIQSVVLTQEDLDDIRNIFPFVLTSQSIGLYNLTYRGMELIDEIDTYVFDVGPKALLKDKRFFEGRIWVDQQDLQIVKTYGTTVFQITSKNKDQRFPRFETYRNMVDGKYWFPVYTKADDVLKFPSGQDVRIREVVKWENYKLYRTDVKITVADDTLDTKPEKK
jgi:hypothetical protein